MITEEKKKELFPFFALIYSQQINPEKYGAVESFEEWSKILDENPEDVDKITQAATQLSEEQWEKIQVDYETEQTDTIPEGPVIAKKGAKLNNLQRLQSYKKGKKVTKKCACGCDMVSTKGKGGKIISKCSCGCKN